MICPNQQWVAKPTSWLYRTFISLLPICGLKWLAQYIWFLIPCRHCMLHKQKAAFTTGVVREQGLCRGSYRNA